MRGTTETELVLGWHDRNIELISGTTDDWKEWLAKTVDLEDLACALSWFAGLTLSAIYDGKEEWGFARADAGHVKLVAERMLELLQGR